MKTMIWWLALVGLTGSVPAALFVPPVDERSKPAPVTLAWDASPDPVDGYYLYEGPASGEYHVKLDIGAVLTFSKTNLARGTTYFYVVTAYRDASGTRLESGPSNEINYTPARQPTPPFGLKTAAQQALKRLQKALFKEPRS